MSDDEMFEYDAAVDEMLLDNAFQDGRVASAVPRAFRVDDRDGSAFADAQAVCFRPQHAASIRETELLQPPLQVVPCGDAALLVATFRRRLIGAKKDVPARNGHADAGCDILLGLSHIKTRSTSQSVHASIPRPHGRRRDSGERMPWRTTRHRRSLVRATDHEAVALCRRRCPRR